MSTKARSGELDVWKFIFALFIVIFHSSYLPIEIEKSYFHGASIFVEFFFIASGYLMAASASKKKCQNVSKETINFLKRKVWAFYPYLVFGFIIAVLTKSVYNHQGFWRIIKNMCNGIAELMLLKSTGVTGGIFNLPMWYISAMIVSMAVLYPLILKYGELFKKIACPLIAFFLLGYLRQKYGHFRAPEQWDGFVEKGMIRGFAELALGVYCYEIGTLISDIKFTKFSKLIFTGIEYGSLLGILFYSNKEVCFDMDVPSVLLFSVSIIIICGNHSLLAPFWNKLKFTRYLGKFSMMIYINHIYWIWILGILGLNMSYERMLVVYVFASVFSAFLCWGIVDGISRIVSENKEKIKRIFIEI